MGEHIKPRTLNGLVKASCGLCFHFLWHACSLAGRGRSPQLKGIAGVLKMKGHYVGSRAALPSRSVKASTAPTLLLTENPAGNDACRETPLPPAPRLPEAYILLPT